MAEQMLTAEQLSGQLSGRWAGRQIKMFQETDSTNIQCGKLAKEGWPEGTLIIAESQSAGKGRRGRTWVSPAGTGIWMSLLLRPEIPADKASMLTLVAALAVEKGIQKGAGLQSWIKWPNDLVINEKKICGILTEMRSKGSQPEYVVVGIGINANMTEFPEEIRDTATSLYLEKGEQTDRIRIISEIMAAFEEYYQRFLENLDLGQLKEEYDSRLINLGRQVTVLDPAGAYTGICRGIGAEGELIVELPDGKLQAVVSGEVSVRGVYGYV